ncbi:MAG: aldo/keto reductase, partial [Spirochaetota bacterium]
SGVNEREALMTVEAALENGVNFFDTAPIYGFGRSQELLGSVLSSCRGEVIIADKCGLEWNTAGKVTHSLSRDSIFRSLEGSLRRLRTDYIDLYQIHWSDPATPLSETMAVLSQLREAGAIREIGVCNLSPEQTEEACSLAPVVSYQGLYNYLQRGAEEKILPLCKEKGISFISYSSLAQGMLGGNCRAGYTPSRSDIRRFNPLFCSEESISSSIQTVAALGKRPASASLRFLSENDAVTGMLVSMTKIRHLEENISALAE